MQQLKFSTGPHRVVGDRRHCLSAATRQPPEPECRTDDTGYSCSELPAIVTTVQLIGINLAVRTGEEERPPGPPTGVRFVWLDMIVALLPISLWQQGLPFGIGPPSPPSNSESHYLPAMQPAVERSLAAGLSPSIPRYLQLLCTTMLSGRDDGQSHVPTSEPIWENLSCKRGFEQSQLLLPCIGPLRQELRQSRIRNPPQLLWLQFM